MLSYASNNISIYTHSHNLHSCLTTFFLSSIYTLNYILYLLSIYTLAYLHFLSNSSIYIFFTFSLFILLTMSTKKTFDPNALKRPVTRSRTAHERQQVVCKDFIVLLNSIKYTSITNGYRC